MIEMQCILVFIIGRIAADTIIIIILFFIHFINLFGKVALKTPTYNSAFDIVSRKSLPKLLQIQRKAKA